MRIYTYAIVPKEFQNATAVARVTANNKIKAAELAAVNGYPSEKFIVLSLLAFTPCSNEKYKAITAPLIAEQVPLILPRIIRDKKIAEITDQAEDILRGIKPIFFCSRARHRETSNQEVAEYYDVSIDAVKSARRMHKIEFGSYPSIDRWIPINVLRLSYFLEDSEMATDVQKLILAKEQAHENCN